jgi:hypothetical protein
LLRQFSDNLAILKRLSRGIGAGIARRPRGGDAGREGNP